MRHENARPADNGAGQESHRVTASIPASLARPRVTVIDCACGRCHHVDEGALAELGADCKPELVGVSE